MKRETPFELMPEDFDPPAPHSTVGRPESPWFLMAQEHPGRWVQIGLGEKPNSRYSSVKSGVERRNKKLGGTTKVWESRQRGGLAYIRYSPPTP